MGNKLDKTDFVDYVYISRDRRVYVGNRNRATLAKRSSACCGIYVINAHYATFQEIMAEKQGKIFARQLRKCRNVMESKDSKSLQLARQFIGREVEIVFDRPIG